VSLRPQAGTFGPALAASIRGIGQYDFNTAFEPGVGVYVDDVYYPTLTGSVFDLLDLDRVEILRGPQGTLAGRNSIGGAIRLYSRRPEGSNSGSMTVTYGSRDRMEIRGSMDLGILPGVNFRMAGVAKEQDGYVDRLDYACLNPGSGFPQLTTNSNCRLGRDGGVGTMAFRGQLGLEPSDNLTITIIGDYTHEDHTTAGQVLRIANYTGPFDIDPYNTGTPFDSRFICGRYCNYATLIDEAEGTRPLVLADNRVTFEGFGFSGHVDLELSDALALQSITSYREFDTQFSTDNDLSPLAHSLGTNFLPFWAFSQEIRLNGQLFNEVVDFTLGGFYMDQRSYVETIQDLRYSPLPTFYQNDPVNADSKAAFAHASIHATDALTFNLGIRYTDEHKDYTFVRLPPFGGAGPLPILGPLNGVTGVYDGPQSTRFDYRANVSYEFTPDIMAYAQISTGFKGGGISPRPFNAAQVLPFAPETLTAYELGIKTDLLNRRLRLNAAVFLSDYNDLLLTLNPCPQISPGPCALQTNAGSATITGFELEMNAEPADGLLIDAALSYVDFDYDTINPLASSIQLDFVPPYTPKWKWSIGTQYEIPFGNGDSLTPRIDLTYQSEMYSNPTNAPSSLIESYTLVNARLTYTNEDADVDVSLQVTNLFDEYHILTVFDQSASAGYAINQPGRPREWAISVTKRF
jgi:iron complex outermembrane receptor protein